MSQAVYRLSSFPRERVIGMAGVLDSARMRTFIAMELNVSRRKRLGVRAGRPRRHDGAAAALLDGRRHPDHRTAVEGTHRRDLSTRTANGGAEITKLVGTSAWYAPGASAAQMVEAILKDQKKILPCSVFLQGEYGIHDLFVGVPVKLGARGVEQIIEIS